jgi:serine acetyltransferase
LNKLLKLIRSDICKAYDGSNCIKMVGAVFTNPSIQACILIRCAQFSPFWCFWIFRRLLISLHAIDFGRGAVIGPKLLLPHPVNIVIGQGAKIGSDCTIFHGVTIGQGKKIYPNIGDRVTIYPNSFIVGGRTINSDSIIKPCSFISASRWISVVDRS